MNTSRPEGIQYTEKFSMYQKLNGQSYFIVIFMGFGDSFNMLGFIVLRVHAHLIGSHRRAIQIFAHVRQVTHNPLRLHKSKK